MSTISKKLIIHQKIQNTQKYKINQLNKNLTHNSLLSQLQTPSPQFLHLIPIIPRADSDHHPSTYTPHIPDLSVPIDVILAELNLSSRGSSHHQKYSLNNLWCCLYLSNACIPASTAACSNLYGEYPLPPQKLTTKRSNCCRMRL